MADAKVTFFPVGNGDCVLITLSDDAQMLIDCNITEDSRDDDEESCYDVHAHLLECAKKLEGIVPHIDALALTHPDQDHCRGLDTTFYTGDPASYGQTHLKQGLLLVDELWFTPRVFSPHESDLCETAVAFRKEARRRMALHKARAAACNLPGNRIRIIGYTDNPDLKGLEHLTTVPGNFLNFINGKQRTDFRFFVHAPFKIDTDDKWAERNDTSLVLQARFDVDGVVDAACAMFGGDAGPAIWEKILERSDEDTLKWDLLLAVHHCSWTFFSESPYKDNKVPAKASLKILDQRRKGAHVVASCKPILNDDDNPPHWAAAKLYKNAVGAESFHVTSETPSKKRPLPIDFVISSNGPVLEENSGKSVIASSAAVRSAVGTPKTYGRR